jgi:hypothetical protein
MRIPAVSGVKVTLTTQMVAVVYVFAPQVLFFARAKSMPATPVVSTPMLPTFVPAPIVKGRETAALVDPTA